MLEPFLGTICLFGFNFAPKGWAFCQGQLMSIAQNTALFSLLGTTYGGDGRVTFGLPDLRGRAPIGQGQGPGLSPRTLGEMSGTENVTLLITEMPAHNHVLEVSTATGTQNNPSGAVPALAVDANEVNVNVYNTTINAIASPQAISPAGNSQPHNNMQPYLVMNYSIALQGIFPSRN